jgi:hypothetical protein
MELPPVTGPPLWGEEGNTDWTDAERAHWMAVYKAFRADPRVNVPAGPRNPNFFDVLSYAHGEYVLACARPNKVTPFRVRRVRVLCRGAHRHTIVSPYSNAVMQCL